MVKRNAFTGNPYAGNPHVRFDEGEVASAATPRRGSLLYNIKKLTPLVAICVTAEFLPALADGISVAPVLDSSGLETQFNLTLDVSSARYLCAAWAEMDQGADYTAWTNRNFKVLGEVDPSTTAWTFDAPKGWGAEMRALRFFLVEKESRPYDSRVEWIESTGREWINTGYIGQYGDVYDLHFKWLGSGTYPMGSYGGSKPADNKRYGVLDLGGNAISPAMNSQVSSNDPTRDSRRKISSGEELYTRTTMQQGEQSVSVNTTGFDDMGSCRTSTIRATAAVGNTTAPLYVFARNCGNTSMDITHGGTVDLQVIMRLYSCYTTHNGTPVLDFIPCVKDGEAMLYNRVNGNLHRNVSGAGAFVAGPVVEELLLGTTAVASSTVVPSRPVALITTTSATTGAVNFSATLAQSAAAVSATFAYGDSPDSLGAATEVSAAWTQGGTVTFSATGLSAGERQYGVLTLSQNGAALRTYGFWFAAACAEGRAVAVGSEKAGGVIEAVISKAAGTTNVLFVAHGATPGGDTPESWANCERVCMVDGEAQTIDVTVPGWGDAAVAMRFFLKEYNAYPYDAQVKWIASTGNEWINTGYVSRTNDVYQLSFRDDCTNSHFIVGAYGSAGIDAGDGTRVTVMQVTKRNGGSYGYGLNYGFAINKNYTEATSRKLELGVDLTLQAEFLYKSQTLKEGRTGGAVTYLSGTTLAADIDCDSPVYVFASNAGNASTDIAATATKVDNKATARVYSLLITHNGEPARDFIPVVKNGVGGLYDRVLKRCHWNVSGAGAFTYGPELPESGGEPGGVAACSAVHLARRISGEAVLKGAYATSADFAVTLGSAGAAATANVVLEYGTTAEYGASAVVDAAMMPGVNRNFTLSGLAANTSYFWRATANGEEIAAGAFTTQGAYRTVTLRETVESADGETLCCRLDFGAAVQNETCRLVMAYGAEDGGVELSSWENCVVAGTVAPGENSFEYNLPAGLVAGEFKYRFYLVAEGDTPPGVSQVSYIESTGAEYINTGYVGAFDDDYDISFRILSNARKDWILMGSYGNALQHRYSVVQTDGNGKFFVYLDDTNGGTRNVTADYGVDMRLKASYRLGEQTLDVSKNGGAFVRANSMALSSAPINTFAPLYLFCRNCGNVSVDNVIMARLYSCTIKHNGALVRDFVPCVKNGEAGLYDRVSGHFHGNISGNGAFIAGDATGAAPEVYSYTIPTNGVGVAADYASKAGMVTTLSAFGRQVSASAYVASLGRVDTYPRFEWWVEGGSVTNAIEFAAIPANNTAETHEYSATFDAGEVWNRTVYCRFAVSNGYESATGGTCCWQDKTAVRAIVIIDDCTYTWQLVDDDWNGDWTNAAHWASDRPGNCIGIPTAASSVFFPTGSVSRVTMPDGLTEVNTLGLRATGITVEFYNASSAATLKPYLFEYPENSTGTAWNSHFIFNGVSIQKRNPGSVFYVANQSSVVFKGGATINSTLVDMYNSQNTGYEGRLEVGAGSIWPTEGEVSQLRLGGDGVLRVDGTLNVATFMIGQYSNYGGGTLEIGGDSPSVNVSATLRCQNSAGYRTPSHVTFDIPAGGWTTAPLKGTASAGMLASTAAAHPNISTKLILGVNPSSAVIDARKGKTKPYKVPLISWPTGITASRCELAPGNEKRVRLAWTYGGTDSEVDDGNPPTGLVAYVTGKPGMVIIIK